MSQLRIRSAGSAPSAVLKTPPNAVPDRALLRAVALSLDYPTTYCYRKHLSLGIGGPTMPSTPYSPPLEFEPLIHFFLRRFPILAMLAIWKWSHQTLLHSLFKILTLQANAHTRFKRRRGVPTALRLLSVQKEVGYAKRHIASGADSIPKSSQAPRLAPRTCRRCGSRGSLDPT